MTNHNPVMQFHRLRAAAVVLPVLFLGAEAAYPFHASQAPVPQAGQGQVLIQLEASPGEWKRVPQGRVRVEEVEIRRADMVATQTWMRLPLVRSEFSAREFSEGKVWIVDAMVMAGKFDQIRLRAGVGSPLPVALDVPPGGWSIVTLEVGLQATPAPGLLRLVLRRAHTLGPS